MLIRRSFFEIEFFRSASCFFQNKIFLKIMFFLRLLNTNLFKFNLFCDEYKPFKPSNIQLGDKVKIVTYVELPRNKNREKENFEGNTKKERIQNFEGIVIRKHSSQMILPKIFILGRWEPFFKTKRLGSTITVRKMVPNGSVEKIILVDSPWVKSIDILERSKVRKAKLYYLRKRTGKSARLKRRL